MSMLSTFKIIVFPIIILPYSLAYLIQAYTSIKRIQGFLEEPHINLSHIKN